MIFNKKIFIFVTGGIVLLLFLFISVLSPPNKDNPMNENNDEKAISDKGISDKMFVSEKVTDFKNINPQELKKMLSDKDVVLINVHVPYAGDIAETDLSIPYNQIGDLINLSKDKKIVVYCRSGSMSRIAARKLVDMGYKDVYNLENGMIGWENQGNKLVFKDL